MWIPFHRRPSFAQKKPSFYDEEGGRPQHQAIPGFLLKNPKTELLHVENKVYHQIEVGHASMQGYRVSMEDEHIIDHLTSNKDHLLLAVMDGHAGTYAAQYTARNFKRIIEETTEWKAYMLNKKKAEEAELLGQVLLSAYLRLDEELREMMNSGLMDESGCTLVCAIITPTHLVCANVGDSRCVLGNQINTISLTEDHKPETSEERVRIELAGGFVKFNRVNGELAMSRAIGDFRYKMNMSLQVHEHQVIAVPDIAIHERSADDEVAVLACDGVWDVLANEEAIDFLCNIVFNPDATTADHEDDDENDDDDNQKKKRKSTKINEPGKLASAEEAASDLVRLALEDGSMDNITAIVVKFPALTTKK